ncbi:hypothetical protein F5148DRAFT_335717 [Russula earlei]|uniref:Uncharacterized protein n=1 Tax=Russula earlei TaxID=71964 RepID=A0ACC0U1Z8_9AGAM|nr:hypothetical protein F5148DRAFT_335717 [Russula earlei]
MSRVAGVVTPICHVSQCRLLHIMHSMSPSSQFSIELRCLHLGDMISHLWTSQIQPGSSMIPPQSYDPQIQAKLRNLANATKYGTAQALHIELQLQHSLHVWFCQYPASPNEASSAGLSVLLLLRNLKPVPDRWSIISPFRQSLMPNIQGFWWWR